MTEARARILIVDDESDVRSIITTALSEDGHSVAYCADAEEALSKLESETFELAFVDINLRGMSGLELLDKYTESGGQTAIVIITGRTTVANAIEATRRGAYDYVTKPFDLDNLCRIAHQVMERHVLLEELGSLREKARAEYEPGVEIVGQSAAMQELYKDIGRVAGSDAAALIQGESGSGKELIARALHAYSDRWQGPFVAVNCSAIPADLLESEMFGHERGAFTGATDRRTGKFEQANGGTLFLDEVADMPLPLQAKLLRVLQEKEFSRVGGHDLIPTNCRIVTASNRNLRKQVADGAFREDLFFRLEVVVLTVPPLRQRREDIPLLADYFIDRINSAHKFQVRGLSPDALSALASHSWPGNVRELENALVRAAAMSPNRLLTAADIPIAGDNSGPGLPSDLTLEEAVAHKVRDQLKNFGEVFPRDLYAQVIGLIEKPLIEVVLEHTNGNQLRAAEILGINRNTLRKKITDLGIALDREQS